MNKHRLLTWLPLTGLCTVVFALGLIAHDRTHLELVFGLVVTGSLCGFILWHLNTQTTRAILFYAVLFRLVLFGLPPSLSDDAYRYIWDGLVQQHGLNPYQYTPEDKALEFLHDEAVYVNLNSPAFFSVYPPVSQLIFRIGTQFHGQDWWSSHYAIKAILVLAELMAVFLLARLIPARYLMLYAWNPLVLLETAGQAHTESALILLLVMAVYFHQQRRGRSVSVTLSIAGLIKLYPFFFLPLLWRRYGWRGIWPGIFVVIALGIPFAAPYVMGNVSNSLDLYAKYFEFNAGLYYTVKEVMRWLTGDDWSKQLGPLFRTIFLVGLPVLYALDYKFRWTLAKGMLIILGCYLVLTTTVHPWYLLSVIVLCTLLRRAGWHWMWLGMCSVGTYLLYAEGPYWIFVVLGWGGWAILALGWYGPHALQPIMMARARQKYRWIRRYIPHHTRPLRVLDLGCAEGYVGQVIQHKRKADVVLADITDMNRTSLPHTLLQSDRLPWPSEHYDVVLVYFVLHHTQNAELVLREALRVCKKHVIVVESVYKSQTELKFLTLMDKIANHLRSLGKMNAQEEHLHFRIVEEWRALFQGQGAQIVTEELRGYSFFRQALFVLRLGV